MIAGLFAGAALRRCAFVLFLSGLLPVACTPVKPFEPVPSQIPHGQGRLWQIEGPDIETSYVFATYDWPDKRALELPAKASEVFDDSEILVLEGIGDRHMKAEVYTEENMELSDGQTLEDLIGARSFNILKFHMRQGRKAPNNKVKPWVMWYYLGGERFGFGEYQGYEYLAYELQVTRLRQRADEAGMDLAGLMTEQEYFDIYDKIPLDQQADMLKVTLDRYEGLSPQVSRGELYINGDLARLDGLWREYLSWLQPATAATLHARRITDRSRLMVERMLPHMAEQTAFVAIDSLHLPGEQGVLRLLEEQGYTITTLL